MNFIPGKCKEYTFFFFNFASCEPLKLVTSSSVVMPMGHVTTAQGPKVIGYKCEC